MLQRASRSTAPRPARTPPMRAMPRSRSEAARSRRKTPERLAGEAARVRGDRAPRALAPPDLEDDDRLAAIGGAVERGHEALRLAHSLEEHRDDSCRGIVDQVLEEIDRRQDRLVAGRDHL